MAKKKNKSKSKSSKKSREKVDSVRESARKVWMAGLGALAAVEAEGSKLFDTLVEKGEELEQRARPKVEAAAKRAKTKATDSWDKVEKSVGTNVNKAFDKMGVSRSDEVATLRAELDALRAQFDALKGGKPAAKKAGAKKTARKKATKRSAAKKATAKKPAAKKAGTRKSAAKKTSAGTGGAAPPA